MIIITATLRSHWTLALLNRHESSHTITRAPRSQQQQCQQHQYRRPLSSFLLAKCLDADNFFDVIVLRLRIFHRQSEVDPINLVFASSNVFRKEKFVREKPGSHVYDAYTIRALSIPQRERH